MSSDPCLVPVPPGSSRSIPTVESAPALTADLS